MPSDAVVTPRDVLGSLMELRRVGRTLVLRELEQLEPDLLEYALEQLSAVNRRLLDSGMRPGDVRRLTRDTEELALVLITSLRSAHLRLWRDEHEPDGVGR